VGSHLTAEFTAAPRHLTSRGVEPGTANAPADRRRGSINAYAPITMGGCLPSGLAAQGQAFGPAALPLAERSCAVSRQT